MVQAIIQVGGDIGFPGGVLGRMMAVIFLLKVLKYNICVFWRAFSRVLTPSLPFLGRFVQGARVVVHPLI